MPAIFVHGVADTHRIWDGVRSHLERDDVRALSLPGFDAPLPDGFQATKEDYLEWLIAELEQVGEPVDLVGHDWGCILTARLAAVRPDLVRTWAGGSGPVSAAYEWHSFAVVWQTPGEGEAWMATLDKEAFAADYVRFGVPPDVARQIMELLDDTMKDCILRLYRSAVHLGEEWEPGLADATAPSLVFWGVHDVTTPMEFGYRLAGSLRARRVLALDCQHFTPIENRGRSLRR